MTEDELIEAAVQHGLGRSMNPIGMQTGPVFVTDQGYRTGELLAFAKAVATAKTGAQRVTETKQRKRDAGMIEVRSLWVYPEDVPAIRDAAAKLRAKRVRVNPTTQAPKIDRR